MKIIVIKIVTITLITFIGGIKNYCSGQSQLNQLISNSIMPFDSLGQITTEFELTLNSALDNVRIVAIGESTHEDGLTFEHKTRIVKYLHEKLGFNVIAFEFGFYGNWNTNEKLKMGQDVEKATKYSGWAKSKYAFPVYEYISQTHKTDTPLNYAGFDGEKVPDGISNIQAFLNRTIDLIEYSIDSEDKVLLDSLIQAVYGKLGNPYKDALNYKRRKLATDIILDLSNKLIKNRDSIVAEIDERNYLMYKFTLSSIIMDEKTTYAGAFWNIVRDKHMAERVRWLTDSIYKDEKIILWGASAHFARNMVEIERSIKPKDYGYYPYYQMGDWLHTYFGNSFYSIAFTTASGKTGTIYPKSHKFKKYEQLSEIPIPEVNSFEKIAYSTGYPTIYCDLRNVSDNSWLNSRFVSYPFGYNEDSAIWKNVVDGLYFIREMEPDEWIEK